MTYDTQRLTLRPWLDTDAPALYEYACDPQLGPAAGWPPHKSVEDSLEIIHKVLQLPNTYAITCKGGDEAIGSIGLFKGATCREGELEIGYWLGRPFWGEGYATEAVRKLMGVFFHERENTKLWCDHYAGNERSKRVIEKCGFRREFIRESEVPQLGERRTAYYYSIRRGEWAVKSARQWQT